MPSRFNENSEKLIAALKSGKYVQGRETLHEQGCFCWAGLACEVYRQETGRGEWVQDDLGMHAFALEGDSNNYEMPCAVADFFGLMDTNGEYACGTRSLVGGNDCGDSFKELAATMESQPPGLFISDNEWTMTDEPKR